MEKVNVLIIEDDNELNNLLVEFMKQMAYEPISAKTGLEGLNKFRTMHVDIVLLDLMLPYKSGDEVLREIRLVSDIPVIVLSAKDMVRTKIDLLRLGADDYMIKPFDVEELFARIENALRHAKRQVNQEKVYCYKNIEVNSDTKQVSVKGEYVRLTSKEYKILELLIRNPKKLFSKKNLFESAWEEEYIYEDKIINTHISNLRNKLKKADPDTEYIETVWGLGYKIEKE